MNTILLLLACLAPVIFWAGLPEAFEAPKAALLLVAACALAPFVRWRCDAVGLAVLGGVAVAAITTITSISPRFSLLGAEESQGGLVVLVSLAVVHFAARSSDLRPQSLAAALTIACAIAAGYGLIQAIGLDPLPWKHQSGFAGWIRPTSTEGHPIKLASLLVIAAPLVLWRGSWTVALSAVVVLLCLARGAWLGGSVGLVVWMLLRHRIPWRALVGLSLVVVVVAWFVPLFQRAAGMGEGRSRLLIWETCWNLFLDRPLVGSGPDTLHLVFGTRRTPEYWDLEWGRTPLRAHNDFLHLLATQGILGGLAHLALVAALIRAVFLAWQRAPQDRSLIAALASCLAAHQACMLTGFSTIGSSVPFALMTGLLARLSLGPFADVPARDSLVSWRLLPGAAVACLLLMADREEWHRHRAATSPPKEALAACEHRCRLVPMSAEAHADRGRALLEMARQGKATCAEVCRAYERAAELDPTDAVHRIAAARACIALGELERAERWIERAERTGMRHASIRAERAALHLARGEIKEADAALDAAGEFGDDAESRDRATGARALVRLSQSRYAEALTLASALREARPEWPVASRIVAHAEAGLRRAR